VRPAASTTSTTPSTVSWSLTSTERPASTTSAIPREEITIGDLAVRIAAYYGREVTLKPSELPKGSPTRRAPDIGKLRALGYEPKVSSLGAGEGTLEWYRESSEVAA
jgi:nucleoside-diphosphate-sugar epimerase